MTMRAMIWQRLFRLAPGVVAILPLLAGCGGGGSGQPQATVTVTSPAGSTSSGASASSSGASASASPKASRPEILAVTKAGALVRLNPVTGAVELTLVPSGVIGDEISVSPDHSTVYYAHRSGCVTEVMSVSVGGGGSPVPIAPGQLPAVSPDGTKLAFAREPVPTAKCVPNPSNLASLYKVVIQTLSTGSQKVLSAPPQVQSYGLFAPISHLSWAADNVRLVVSTSAVQDNEGWNLSIVDTSVAQYYVVPGAGITSVPVTGAPDAQRSYIREGIFLPDGNLFISRACCGGVPIRNTSRLMWVVTPGGTLVKQVAIGYPNLEHVSLAASSTGEFLLYLAGTDLYVSDNGNRPARLASGLIAATWA